MSIRASAFAAVYDLAMRGVEQSGLAAHRERLLSGAAGRVLEIGGGTGANLAFYPDRVDRIVISEPDGAMARRLARKLVGYRLPASLVRAPAERLPLASESFDHAVSTLVLCTVPDPARALAEVHRLLRPGGRLLFIEHVRSEDPGLARWQARLRRPWAWLGHGCQTDRDTIAHVHAAGFSIVDLKRDRLPGAPPIVAPLVVGVAVSRPSSGRVEP